MPRCRGRYLGRVSGGVVVGRISLCQWKRATGIEPVLRAWKTRACLPVRSHGVSARLYTAETADGGDPARRDESTQDTPLVTATVTTVLLARTQEWVSRGVRLQRYRPHAKATAR